MKTKFIAASILALCSTAAFAAKGDLTTGPVTCPAGETTVQNALATVNACAPDAVVYVAGSSALGAGIEKSITALFTGPVIKVLDGSAAGFSKGVDVAFYGMRDGARLLVVYNPQNGSAAGVSQIFATPKTVVPSKGDSANKTVNLPESRVVHVGPVGKIANDCTIAMTTGTTPAPVTATGSVAVVTCSYLTDIQADVAISDVRTRELYSLAPQLYKAGTGAFIGKYTNITEKALGMQGFGVAVNWNMYKALQDAQVTAKTLGASCNGDDVARVAGACQPSIRSADYSKLVTKDKAELKNLAALDAAAIFGIAPSKMILARRDDLSGTQAVSNMHFANGACGVIPAKSTNLGGALHIVNSADAPLPLDTATINNFSSSTIGAANFAVADLAISSHVTNVLNTYTEGYAIGVRNVTRLTATSGTVRGAIEAGKLNFVKVDGISPNLVFNAADGTYTEPSTGLGNWANGSYPMAVVSYAVLHAPTSSIGKKIIAVPAKKNAIDKLVELLSTPASTSAALGGVAYLEGAIQPATAKRGYDGNNCSPLVAK